MSSASTAGGAASLMSPAGSSRHHVAGRAAQRMAAAGEGSALPLSPSKLESPFFKERVAALLTQGDAYAKRLDGERRRAAELDAALAALRAQHLAAHRQLRAGGDERKSIEDSANGSASAKLPLRTLENRLEQVLTRFNQVRSANKALRDDIQALRRDKVTQQQIHDRLARETHTASAELAKVTQAAQAAGDARDRAARQVEALRAQQADDGAEFEAGWHERAMQLEQDRAGIRDLPRLRTPKPKSTPHFCADGAPASPAPRALAPSGAGGNGSNAGFKLLSTPEVKLRDEAQKTGWLISEKEGDLRRQSERLRAAEDGLAKIKRRTGVADAQELARALVAAEEKNFSLFNMINELGTEMEALEVDNKALEEQIAQCAGSGRSSDAHRRELQQQLEAQIDVSKSKMQFLEARQGEATDALEAMKQGALAIFHKVGSADEAFAALLAAHGLTDVTLAKLLGVIEQRVGELVDMHNLTTAGSTAVDSAIGPVGHPLKPDGGGDSNAHHKGGRRTHASGGHGGGHQTASNAAGSGAVGGLLRPTPPTADDFNDSDGEDGEDAVRPCRIADIQEKTAAAVGRRKEKQMRSKR